MYGLAEERWNDGDGHAILVKGLRVEGSGPDVGQVWRRWEFLVRDDARDTSRIWRKGGQAQAPTGVRKRNYARYLNVIRQCHVGEGHELTRPLLARPEKTVGDSLRIRPPIHLQHTKCYREIPKLVCRDMSLSSQSCMSMFACPTTETRDTSERCAEFSPQT